jgi:hypothetical protein
MKHTHEVVVGNIGTVYSGTSRETAGEAFQTYAEQSETNYGRVAGETVTWLDNGEIVKEHVGRLEQAE